MTVQDLIRALSLLPPDALVLVDVALADRDNTSAVAAGSVVQASLSEVALSSEDGVCYLTATDL